MKHKKEPWRLLVGIAAIAYIVYTWADKDLLSAFTQISPEQALPMAATSVMVTGLKVGLLAAVIFAVKGLLRKK